jgi:hypothetical protein
MGGHVGLLSDKNCYCDVAPCQALLQQGVASRSVAGTVEVRKVVIVWATIPLVLLLPGWPQSTLGAGLALSSPVQVIDPAFTQEVHHAVVVLLGEELPP